MKLNLFAIAALSLAATLGAAQSQKAPARKADPKSAAKTAAAKTPEAKPAPAKAAASPAAKDAPNDPSMSGDGRVTQVYTPKLPPLPAGAVQIEKNAWRATDKDGITYIYRRTPFGFSKYEASDVPAEEPVTGLTAIDKGDTVEFQRKTPFGLSKWTKPKAELDENETAALKQAAQSASKSAPGKAQE
ncbi:MAG: hypothetical protein IPJ98_02560 [Bryobacterales bacterium]|nr:hypothetical protein [Bryobacterales bacterium]